MIDRRRCLAACLCACAAGLALLPGCGESPDSTPKEQRPLVIGFLYVGETDDHGYNQAAHEGALAVARAFPQARIIERQNVPESPEAAGVMQGMIDRGASIVFPTSFGHLEPALEVAARNPDVTFLHQGGHQTAANLGSYFGTIWDAEYAAGQAAGLASRSDRLGFVAAFPIAQSLLTINAFQLGAHSVNPEVRTRVVFTSSWCAPARQSRAARQLLRWGADVLTQHQDCTASVIRTAAQAGAKTVGFHADASELAPDAWLTGARWIWGELFVDMVSSVRTGRFSSSPYAGRLRVGLREGAIGLSPFGRAATPLIRRMVTDTLQRLRTGRLKPFTGPVHDQQGRLRIRGAQPSTADLEEMDYLVRGVVGDLR